MLYDGKNITHVYNCCDQVVVLRSVFLLLVTQASATHTHTRARARTHDTELSDSQQ